jgi:hypothetical protein
LPTKPAHRLQKLLRRGNGQLSSRQRFPWNVPRMRLVDGSLEKLLAHACLDKFEVLDCLRGLLHRGSWKTAGVMSAAIGERSGLRHALSQEAPPASTGLVKERV